MEEITNKTLSLKQIVNHQHFKYFLLYSFSFFIHGQVMTCLGPMIPYLAAHQGRQQTQYSFLFGFTTIGLFLGSILAPIVGKRLKLHQFIGLGNILKGAGFIMFGQFQNMYMKGFCIFIVYIGYSLNEVLINTASLVCFEGENLSSWLQVIHGFFGIGCLFGPILVYIFELNSFNILGLFALITILFYKMLETPQKMVKEKEIQQKQNKKLRLPIYSIFLISTAFLLALGQSISYGGWISSYAVLSDFSTKQHATFYSSLYWSSIGLFIFLMVLVPGSATNKIKWLALMALVNSFVGYFIIFYIDQQIGLIFMSIVYGICNSILQPLLFVIAAQFGFQVTLEQSSIFIFWNNLGQGTIPVAVGKMMQWFSYNWLLYSMALLNIALFMVIKKNANILEKFKSEIFQQGKLQNLMNSYSPFEQIRSNHKVQYKRHQEIEMKEIRK